MTPSNRRLSPGFAPICLCLLIAIPGIATANSLTDTHRFRLGVTDQEIDIEGHASRKPRPPVDIEFDEVLGLEDSSDSIYLSYRWRFAERWSLYALYSNFEATGSKLAVKDFVWDDQDISAGVLLDTEFGLDTYLVEATYSFVRDERKEFGLGLGLHAFDIETVIEIDLGVNEERREAVRTNAELLAPLPNLIVFGGFMINPRWEISGSAGWLSLNYEDYSGDYFFGEVTTEYRITDKFGIGAKYQMAEIDVSYQSGKKDTAFDIDFYGPSIFLTYGF